MRRTTLVFSVHTVSDSAWRHLMVPFECVERVLDLSDRGKSRLKNVLSKGYRLLPHLRKLEWRFIFISQCRGTLSTWSCNLTEKATIYVNFSKEKCLHQVLDLWCHYTGISRELIRNLPHLYSFGAMKRAIHPKKNQKQWVDNFGCPGLATRLNYFLTENDRAQSDSSTLTNYFSR